MRQMMAEWTDQTGQTMRNAQSSHRGERDQCRSTIN